MGCRVPTAQAQSATRTGSSCCRARWTCCICRRCSGDRSTAMPSAARSRPAPESCCRSIPARSTRAARLERQRWIAPAGSSRRPQAAHARLSPHRGGPQQLASERSRWEQLSAAIAGILNPRARRGRGMNFRRRRRRDDDSTRSSAPISTGAARPDAGRRRASKRPSTRRGASSATSRSSKRSRARCGLEQASSGWRRTCATAFGCCAGAPLHRDRPS